MLTYPAINPIALQIGPLSIHWYGLMYGMGLFLAHILGRYRAKRSCGWSESEADHLVFYAMLGVVIGGRLGYSLFYNSIYSIHHPLSVFAIWEGGMSFHGGLLGVLVSLIFCAQKLKKDFWAVADFIAPLVPLGLALGRIGNFINGELWGRPTILPWAMQFPKADLTKASLNLRHPSQLYECALEGVLLFILIWVFSKKPKPVGAVSGLFASLYAAFRFIAEYFREPDAHLGFIAFNWLTMGQLLSLPLFVVGLWLLYRAKRLA